MSVITPTVLTAYHWEGHKNFVNAGSVPLSVESLRADRPLFLAYDSHAWSSPYLDSKDYWLYEVKFIKPTTRFFTHSQAEYLSLFNWSEERLCYEYSELLKEMIGEGCHYFELSSVNDEQEKPEFFLINPKLYVYQIERV